MKSFSSDHYLFENGPAENQFFRLTSLLFFLLSFTGCDKRDGISNLRTFVLPDLVMHQSMAFNEEIGFFVTPIGEELICDIFNLSTCEQITRISLDYSDYQIPHANTSCFGKSHYSDVSIAPPLYISSWNNQRQAFVYDIINQQGRYGSSLIQVIDPRGVSEDIIGGGFLDWVVDVDGGYLYSIAYHLKGTFEIVENNYTHITKFKLPALNRITVQLTDADVEDYFTVPVMTVFQDKDFLREHIYVIAGMPDAYGFYPPRFFDINIEKKELKEYRIPLDGEPEGFCIYKGQKWMNMYDSQIIYNLNDLIEF